MVESLKRTGIVAFGLIVATAIFTSFRLPPVVNASDYVRANHSAVNHSAEQAMPAGLLPWHPIFVSVTEMNHNQQDKTFEISCKIFTDDLETVLTKSTGARIDLFNPKDTALTGKQISSYIGKHLVVKLDGKPVQLNFIGFERELDAVWSYFEVSQVNTVPKTVSVMNNLLYDNFREQINLMHVTVGGKRKSTKLDNPESVADFSF